MTRDAAVLGAALVLMLSHSPLRAQNQVLGEIPIELERNKTLLPVTVGSSGPLRLILDSGMARDGLLLFDASRLDLTRFDHLEEYQVRGAGPGGAARALSSDAASFTVGALRFDGQRVTILTGEATREFPSDGVIGHSLLGHYAVEVDYDRNRLILYEPSTFSPVEGWKSLDIYFKDNRIPWTEVIVTTAEEDPVRLSTYIDFASGEALELLERETNLFTVPEETRERSLGRGLSGEIHGREGRISTLRLGPFVLHDVAVVVTPAAVRSRQAGADAILGNDALRRFNVIFDYAHLKIHLRPSHFFSVPFDAPRARAVPEDR